MSSLFTTDKPAGKLPLSESTNYYANSDSTPTGTTTTTTTTPSKLTKNSSISLSTQTPPSTATTSLKRTNQGGFDIFGFNTPLRTTHLDPTILSTINFDSNFYNMQSTYLSPASSSPQQQHQQQEPQEHPQSLPSVEEPEKEKGSPPIKKKRSKSTSPIKSGSTTTPITSTNKPFSLYSEEKPPYSYATLIGISILSHPEKRLTLSNIYQWISDTFRFYKKEDVGWQNSIRHNLSLNKAFVKGDKSKDGKGHYWCIKPGFEEQFLKSRSVKKSSYHEVMDQLNYATKINAALAAAQETTKQQAAVGTTEQKIASDKNISSKKRTRKQPITLMSSPTIPQERTVDEEQDSSNSEDDDGDDDYGEEDLTILDPPVKKFKSQRNSDNDTEEEDSLLQASTKSKSDNTYILDLPWSANTSYSESPTKLPPISHLTNSVLSTPKSTPNRSSRNSANNNIPQFQITESPENVLAGKNLTFTSSFSCNSNFELSPLRTSETGPLLEPVTPANNNSKRSQHHIAQLAQSQPSSVSSSTHLQHTNSIFGSTSKQMFILTRTPKSTTTPLRKTPTTNSIISYLEEYFSPLNENTHSLHHQQQPQLHQLHYASNLHIPASHPLHYIQTPPSTSANANGTTTTTSGSLLMQSTLLSASSSSASSTTSSHSKLNNVVASSTKNNDNSGDDKNDAFVAFQSSPILKRGFYEKSKNKNLIQELEKLQRES
ncbi:Hcm1 protein [Candida orthopsilosis Co 90-125]|uniref:Hcm1 protein n=1 Tax=Candida orthopsilosis (strain 90-125) TaxID=1136231 RepID=H8WWB3_CANO9|nr:Hcm1 protein [Candida orthopsilosis Co 90-125]CCG20737.1 Hcm1 protein [Candida orthopsilosis Co 90-125]